MKSNKRLWALSMAGALAVSNLSAIATPFGGLTAFAAVKPTGATLALSEAEIIKGDKTTATFKEKADALGDAGEEVEIKIFDADNTDVSGKFTVGTPTTTNAVTDGDGFAANSVVDITAKADCPAGIYTVKAKSSTVTTAVEKTLKVKSPASTISITGETNNIPTKEATWSGYTTDFEDLTLTATETVATGKTPEDIQWVIYDSKDQIATNSFTITTDSVTSTGEEEVVIAAKDATTAKGGYYVVAQTPDKSIKSDKYGFTVVADPVLSVESKNAVPASILAGDEIQLLAYSNGKDQITSGLKWSLTNEADKTKATISDSGLISVLSEEAANGITFDVAYKMNDDMSIKKATAFSMDIAASDYEVKLEKTPLEIGESTKATLMFGKEAFEGSVKWTSNDPTVAKIDNDGNITAVGNGTVKFTAAYKVNNSNKTKESTELTVNNISAVYKVNGKAGTTANVTIGKTVQLSVENSNGSALPEYEWVTSNEKVATVDKNGLVTVKSTAAPNVTAVITAIDKATGANVGGLTGVTITAVEAAYTLEAEGITLVGTATPYTASMYYGEEGTLTALLDGEKDNEGEWSIDTSNEGNIVLKNNVITVKKPISATDNDGTVLVYQVDGATKLTLTVKATADDYILSDCTGNLADKKAEAVQSETYKKGTQTIAKLEAGETYAFSVKKGTTDITEDMNWNSDNPNVATVEDGVITTLAAGKNTLITGTYTVDDVDLAIFEITITQTVVSTGAAQDAETATNEAKTAEDKATAATTAAEAAATAAEATKKDPTAENLAKAEEALKTANSNLGKAQTALSNAEKALEKAIADKAESASAQKAVEAAQDAVDKATEAVEKAANDVAAAKKTFDEAASEVEKAKKAEEDKKKQEEEQKKAADGSAANTPAPVGTELVDANGNKTGFKVTDANASAPEVEYEAPADKNATKADIPETYTDLSGNVYKVVGIDARAFKDTKVKTVTIRKNIKRIDPKAFEKSKVKNVKIKGTKLTKKMAKSFKKLKKGGKIKCSGSHKKKNKEILNNLSTVKNGKTKVK